MTSTNAGVNVPGTEVLLVKNYPKPKTCSCWEGRNGSNGMVTSVSWYFFHNFPDVRIFPTLPV